MPTQILHGDIPQEQREIVFKAFHDGKVNCLIATDVAARGLDFPNIDLILQVNPPQNSDSYVHRSGRTGRAGMSGKCITFFSKSEHQDLIQIEREINLKMTVAKPPSALEVIDASKNETLLRFRKVNPTVIEKYEPIVSAILEDFKGPEALARALALMGGNEQGFNQKSLITNEKGLVTFQATGDIPMHLEGLFPFFKVFNTILSREEIREIKNIRRFEDNTGFAFDIDEHKKEDFLMKTSGSLVNKHFIEECKTLPDLKYFRDRSENRRDGENDRRNFNDRRESEYFNNRRESGRRDFNDRNGRRDFNDRNDRRDFDDSNGRRDFGGRQNPREFQNNRRKIHYDSDSDSDFFSAWGKLQMNKRMHLSRGLLKGFGADLGAKALNNGRFSFRRAKIGFFGMAGLFWYLRN